MAAENPMSIQEVRLLISEKEEELRVLQETLAQLLGKPDSIVASVLPFSRTPPEILSEIFSHCIDNAVPPSGENSLHDHAQSCLKQGQLRLMRVSRLWRAIVTSTPSFWTCISIDLGRGNPRSSTYFSVAPVIEFWCEKSAHLPLDIDLFHPWNGNHNKRIYLNLEPILSALDIFAAQVSRWASFKLVISDPTGGFEEPAHSPLSRVLSFAAMVKSGKPFQLRRFTSSVHDTVSLDSHPPLMDALAFFLSASPQLKEATWGQSFGPLLNLDEFSQSLTSLTVGDYRVSLLEDSMFFLTILRRLPLLETLYLSFIEDSESAAVTNEPPVVLSKLSLLSISHREVIPHLLKYISVPNLKSLSIRQWERDTAMDAPACDGIAHLVLSSQCSLESLDLDVYPGRSHLTDILNCDHVRSSLRDLVLYADYDDVVSELKAALLLTQTVFPALTKFEILLNLNENGSAYEQLVLDWAKRVSDGDMPLKKFKATLFMPCNHWERYVIYSCRPIWSVKDAMKKLEAAGVDVESDERDE